MSEQDQDPKGRGFSQPPTSGTARRGRTDLTSEDFGKLLHNRGWVSLREFLKIAEVTYPTALRWCRLKMINYIQVGGTKRVYQDEIRRYLTKGTLPPDPEELAKEKDRRVQWQINSADPNRSRHPQDNFKRKSKGKGKLPTF